MDENVINDVQVTPEEEFEIGLPDGWAEGDDIFADPSTWSGNKAGETSEELSPTTTEATGETEQGAEVKESPTTRQEEAAPKKLKFQAMIDHKQEDVEIDESELPTLYQKAKNLERAQERSRRSSATVDKLEKLAKVLEYTDTDDFFSGTVENLVTQRKNELMSEGVHEAVAERMARQDYADLLADVSAKPEVKSNPGRDFTAETQELLSKHPELGPESPVPNEVVAEAARPGGPTLLQAYDKYLEKQKANMSKSEKAELENLRKENQMLKQNAEAASRAPVTSVTKGGATKVQADDPFIAGLMSDELW